MPGCYVTKFAPRTALKLTAWCKLTFDERVVLHRVVRGKLDREDPVGNENNYFTEMCSGSEAGSYLKLIDFVYHSTLGLRVIKKKKSADAAVY